MAEAPLLGATLTGGGGGAEGAQGAQAAGRTSLPAQQTPFAQKMQGLMQNPNFRAFMLNMAGNFAAGNDLGTSAALGGAGVGRANIAAFEMAQAERARDDALAREGRAAGRSGGRGRGAGSAATEVLKLGISEDLKRKDLVAMFEDTLEGLQLADNTEDMAREELKGLAWIETLSRAGNSVPSQMLAQLQDPSQRSQFLIDFSFGPEAGIKKMEETAAAGAAFLAEIDATQQPPVHAETPPGIQHGERVGGSGPGFAVPTVPMPQIAVPNLSPKEGRAGRNFSTGTPSLGDTLTGRSTNPEATRKKNNPLDADIPPA